MPLFRFDLRRNEEPWSDAEEALDLPSADEARQQAMCMLSEMAKDQIMKARSLAVPIRDEQAEPLTVLTLAFHAEDRA